MSQLFCDPQIRRQFNHGYKVFGNAIKYFPTAIAHFEANPNDKLCLTNHKREPSMALKRLVEEGLRACGNDKQSVMGKNAMASEEDWRAVHTWKKRQCFIGMAEAVLETQTSYQRWTNFKWEDMLRVTALTRVFTQHFLPNSDGDASKLGITNPESWTKRKETKKVPEKKDVKPESMNPTPEKTADVGEDFLISLVTSSSDEEEPAAAAASAAAGSAAAASASVVTANSPSPTGKKKKRGSCLG